MPYLTPEAKAQLSATIRTLRERLLTDVQSEVASRYRLSVPLARAGLAEGPRVQRERLERWLDEQARGGTRGAKETLEQARARHLLGAQKLAAATFLNRLVVLRQIEALGLSRPSVVTGGWSSPGYREFREYAPALLGDESEGYGVLLQLLFDEMSVELPGLFGRAGVGELFPIPATTLRAVIEALDDPKLESAWGDDTTLGWVYQFWNDPDREALDAKIDGGGKIEPHEIAAKTQLFTERYLVEWLLQNAIGATWFAVCEKNGWTLEVVTNGTLDRLEARRVDWRAKRDAGEVSLEALMPIESDLEDRWKYWVPRALPSDATDSAPESLRDLKLLDPACGSGHFLVIAFDLLGALYEEEARHRGEEWTHRQIAEWIVENNLHGVDLDPRAVQIAAAALWLKARAYCREAEPRTMNLVASNLGLAALSDDDPALVELKLEVQKATGIPEDLTMRILHALKGADYLGSLLKVDAAVDEAITRHEKVLNRVVAGQGDLFEGMPQERVSVMAARGSMLGLLDRFLAKCTSGDDLGLRLRGEQLAAGVRFIHLLRENRYDLVVGNPPYQSLRSLCQDTPVLRQHVKGLADLYGAFLLRGMALLHRHGFLAMLTMRNWMFLTQFFHVRRLMLLCSVPLICDLDRGAFEDVLDELVATAMSIVRKAPSDSDGPMARALQPTPLTDRSRDRARTARKRSAVLCQVGSIEYSREALKVVGQNPLIYWWDSNFLREYDRALKLEQAAPARQGLATSDNVRFLREPWEIGVAGVNLTGHKNGNCQLRWAPFIKGAEGKAWFEPLDSLIDWYRLGMSLKVGAEQRYGSYTKRVVNEEHYFETGIAYSTIGSDFRGRQHRYRSVFDAMGQSVFPPHLAGTVCLFNRQCTQEILSALNPTLHFQVGDVNRLPLFPVESADAIMAQLDVAFTEHEAAREPSVEFKEPGPSAWRYAQGWAQRSVDRPAGEPLPPYEPVYNPEPATDHLSFALGVALGRFGAHGEGVLDEAPAGALAHGILFLTASDRRDGLVHPAAQPLHDAWAAHGHAIAPRSDLRAYLRLSFFADIHKAMYESRPIHFPLSSEKKNFVAWVCIHRWTDRTLQDLLAEFLRPELARLEGELGDLQEARARDGGKGRGELEEQYARVQKLRNELKDFIDRVAACAEKGAPQADPRDPPREVDARFHMDLDDGVMINSAALWPLLEPQWKDPKKWWSELSRAQGKKDYDWSHLAARYFPKRVDEKCRKDPSLAVAHGCFWKYHPEKAYQWELRLQDEIGPGFTLDEEGSDAARGAFEATRPEKVRELRLAEEKRRERKAARDGNGRATAEDELPFEEEVEA